eukprot:1153050-Pelagomonas_calceolata.AAC.16
MPNDDALEAQCKAIYEANIAKEGMQLLGWRQVLAYCIQLLGSSSLVIDGALQCLSKHAHPSSCAHPPIYALCSAPSALPSHLAAQCVSILKSSAP